MPLSPPVDTTAPTPLTPARLAAWPLPVSEGDDKYARGTVVVIGGSIRTPGAVLLSGLAALRVGAGRLQLATVSEHAPALGVGAPEALVEGLPSTGSGAIDPGPAIERLGPRVAEADAVLFGPGMEDLDATRALLAGLLPHLGAATILVADALGLVALDGLDAGATADGRGRLVLSPNADEARELVGGNAKNGGNGRDADDDAGSDGHDDEGGLARSLAERFGAAVAVHGSIAAPDGRTWRHDLGGVGLGTSGSGDVLAGAMAGTAARCGDPAHAACWASYLHAAAGDRLAVRIGTIGFLARELLDELPKALEILSPAAT